MAPFLADYIRRLDQPCFHDGSNVQNWRDNPRVHIYTLAQYRWFFHFETNDHSLTGHERNPVWVRLTLERCKEWGCPVPFWAMDYVMRIARHPGYHWPTEAEERRGASFQEAIRKESIHEKNRKYDTPWGEHPDLIMEDRKWLMGVMAELQGGPDGETSEQTSRKLLKEAEECWAAWIQFCFPRSDPE